MDSRLCKTCSAPLVLGENWSEWKVRDRCYECSPCHARRKRPDAKWRVGEERTHECTRCAVVLVPGDNWSSACQKNYSHICRSCQNTLYREWRGAKLGRVVQDRGHALRGIPQTPEHVARRIAAMATTLSNTTRVCSGCNGTFTPTTGSQSYCSGLCWQRSRPTRPQVSRIHVAPSQYVNLVEIFGNECGICGAPPAPPKSGQGKGRLAVDHCHTGGHIRGLLCHRCNTSLGLMRDDSAALRRAADYLDADAQRLFCDSEVSIPDTPTAYCPGDAIPA